MEPEDRPDLKHSNLRMVKDFVSIRRPKGKPLRIKGKMRIEDRIRWEESLPYVDWTYPGVCQSDKTRYFRVVDNPEHKTCLNEYCPWDPTFSPSLPNQNSFHSHWEDKPETRVCWMNGISCHPKTEIQQSRTKLLPQHQMYLLLPTPSLLNNKYPCFY